MPFGSGNAREKALRKELPGSGVEIASLQKFAPGERDFRVAILKIREARPDVVFLHAYNPELDIILRQMKEIAYAPRLTAMGHWGVIDKSPEIYGMPYVESLGNPEFDKIFEKRFGHTPFFVAGYICDTLAMYVEACESFAGNGKPSREFVAQKLEQVKDFPGKIGKLTCVDHWFDAPPSMIVWGPEGRRAVTMEEAAEMARGR